MTHISAKLRQQIAAAAHHRCGYCQTQEAVIGMPLEVEHIVPTGVGGRTVEENLWLACPRCNRYKGMQIDAFDEMTNERVPLFNPRVQLWEDHFVWEQNGLYLVGLTPVGRATIAALQMNNAFVVHSRRIWVAWGWHPPQLS